MPTRYIERSMEKILLRAAAQFPSVVLTGPRQSGKTTILKHLFGESHGYVSLEPPDVRAAAREDPRGFLGFHPPPLILDEVQYCPELLFYIKERIDENREVNGQYLLTGSQNLLLHEGVTESLAGRAAILRLHPLSMRERRGGPQDPLPWERETLRAIAPLAGAELWSTFLRGGFPELIAWPEKDHSMWYSSYLQTYLERDIRSLRQIGDLGQFQIFLQALAAQSGQLLSLSSMSRDLGIAVNTVKQWLTLLEATHQVIVLRPYFANIGKRLVKTPKVYFSDVGMLCHLVGLRDLEHARKSPMSGTIVETAVVNELFRTLWHRGLDPHLYFWRTATGIEVDLLLDDGSNLVPVEVKQTATPRPAMTRTIRSFMSDVSNSSQRGWLMHTGDSAVPLAEGIIGWPIGEM